MSEEKFFPCKSCGANLRFEPGSQTLACPYCGTENAIESSPQAVEEMDFNAFLARAEEEGSVQERLTVKCENCAAETTLGPNVTTDECPFCGTKIVAQAKSSKAIAPRALLPFRIERDDAAARFRRWLSTRWFAPSALRRFARARGLCGVYMPFWTYDCRTTTRYTGQRGEHYWDTERYTTTVNGKTETRTRQVRKTRWYPASGVVRNEFDDILVLGSDALPRRLAEALEPWDLESLVPFQEEYLSGFQVQSYTTGLEEGFGKAQEEMEPEIRSTVRSDIGGDEQRIHSMDVRYRDITFKHILLPVWIAAYRYKDRTYRFLVNARTGEVQGERPWSWMKILLLAASIAAAVAAAILAFHH